MPLIFAECNHPYIIQRIQGKEETRHHLERLGFVSGASIHILSKHGEDLIVLVKGTRLALNCDLARHIHV